eukprot:11188076-Lingulodinium_polyedra.AAC.1
MMRALRQPLVGTEREGWQGHRHHATRAAMDQHGGAFRAAIAERDAGAALRIFDTAANQWLADRIGGDCPAADAAAAKWKRPTPPQAGPDGEAADRAADAALLR